LALTKRLVDLHGGELILRSSVGEGTTVVVRLGKERLIEQRTAP
jgi:signal transduction histidine kinase